MAFSDSASTGLVMPPIGWWAKAHWGLLLGALVLLVMAGQGQHFFYDEWAFVGGKMDAFPFPDRYLLPHNEHWSLLPLLAYRALGATVGVGSYWPYLGLLLLLHLGVTHVLWRLMLVTGSKPVVATVLAAVFSVIGAAAEDLVWAFQIGFVGSTLLGVTAVYLALTGSVTWRKSGVLTAVTLGSLATSGVGLAYLIVVPSVYAWRRRRHAAVVFCLPLLVYATWYTTYSASFIHAPHVSATLPVMVGAFVVLGLTAALTRYLGFENTAASFLVVGVPLLAALTLACRSWWADRTLVGRTQCAMCVGAVAFFSTVGMARAGLGPSFATTARYVYVAIALLLPSLALLISRGCDRHPRLINAVVPVAVAMAVSNGFQLFAYAAETRHDNDSSRRVLVAAAELVRSNIPIFINQQPEPNLAPDLTTTDLVSRHLDPAFAGVSPGHSDLLAASLNLQIRVAPVHDAGMAATCRTTREHRITLPTGRETVPTFMVTEKASLTLTIHEAGSHYAQRVLVLPKGTYMVSSLRDAGDLTIESNSPASLLARCQGVKISAASPRPASVDRGSAR